MNDLTNWDQTLIKKYGSSNHFKLLNQLRNEIIKYPLKKNNNASDYEKVKISADSLNNKSEKSNRNENIKIQHSSQHIDNTIFKSQHNSENNKNNFNSSEIFNNSSYKSNTNDIDNLFNNNNSNISFNNSRNFNIYNNQTNSEQFAKDNQIDKFIDKKNDQKKNISKTFIDRLNDIDLK
tara:strand:+ start:139 stop:675 length:537 start_codon:yes stop_codon:yes gene_type:complete